MSNEFTPTKVLKLILLLLYIYRRMYFTTKLFPKIARVVHAYLLISILTTIQNILG